jgi:transcriptional regulator with XRE-family HTH domain
MSPGPRVGGRTRSLESAVCRAGVVYADVFAPDDAALLTLPEDNMSESETATGPRLLTPTELAMMCRLLRAGRGWTQEVLAEMAKVTVRTVQRIERGEGANQHTLRALAGAFGAPDLDCFMKPVDVPTLKEAKAQKEKFDAEHVTIGLAPVASGRALADLVTTASMDTFESVIELPSDAAQHFAVLTDYYREYRDCHDLNSEVDKLAIYDELQGHIDALAAYGFSLNHAVRKVRLKFPSKNDAEPWNTSILYLVLAPKGKEPKQIVVSRKIQMGL